MVLLWLLALPSAALADATVVVLGLRSVEGDDDVANAMTDQLRGAAREVPGFQVSSAAVSMAQMSLAHGCEEIDAACLNEIARGLSADVVVYGTVRRNSARSDFDYAINLSLFDARLGQIAKAVDDVIPRVASSPEMMSEIARKLMQRLSSTAVGGSITLQANVPDAEVNINDQSVGRTRDGALRMDGLQPGQYRVEIRRENYTPYMSTVTVVEGGDTAITAMLVPLSSPGARMEPDYDEPAVKGHRLGWLGWTLIGVGAVSVAAMAVSMKVITDIDDDPLKVRYADAVALGNQREERLAAMRGETPRIATNVCTQAEAGFSYDLTAEETSDVADLCGTAETFQVLQWVFLGIGIAGVGGGIALVLTAADDPPPDGPTALRLREPVFSLAPDFSTTSGGFRAQLRF